MNFDYTDEQRLIEDGILKMGREIAAAEPLEAWQAIADMGLLAMLYDQADGGLGGDAADMLVVMSSLAKASNQQPFVASGIMPARLLKGNVVQRHRALVASIIDGTAVVAFAYREVQARYELCDVKVRANADKSGYRLDGHKQAVLNGDAATHLIVSARTSGQQRDPEGVTLMLVPKTITGLTCRAYRTLDGGAVADIDFQDVFCGAESIIGTVGDGLSTVQDAIDHATAATIAEAVGLMEKLHSLTLDHLATRKQFGVAMGSFQVLRHKAVDMLVALEQARSMAFYATMMLDATPSERRVAVAAAKLVVNNAARLVGEAAVQLHGGIGLTEEHAVGRLFRRLTAMQSMFADSDHCLQIMAADPDDVLAN